MTKKSSSQPDKGIFSEMEDMQPSQQRVNSMDNDTDPLLEQVKCRMPLKLNFNQ